MAFNRSFEWTKFLDQALHIYLNRTHSTIKMSPLDGEKKANEKIVRNNLHQYFLKRGGKKQKPKFSVGDKGRIWGKSSSFPPFSTFVPHRKFWFLLFSSTL